jgi:DNA polymerase-3 subunit delta'
MNWQIIGHKNILNYLENSIINGRLAHAYLFYGPENVGKKETAIRFIQAVLCDENKKDANKNLGSIPCGVCDSCVEVRKKKYSDFIWIEKEQGSKNISIDQIRELKEKLSVKSFFKSYKIAVIAGSEDLSISAANGLLKILEEPSGKTLIILIAKRINNLPKTIASRSQKILFSTVSKKEIYNFLINEKKIDREMAWNITTLSAGKPGVAIQYIKDNSLWQKYIEDINIFFKLLPAKNHEKLKFAEAFLSKQKTMVEQSEAILPLIDFWQTIFRDLLLSKLDLSSIIINNRIKSEIDRLKIYFKADKLARINKDLETAKIQLKKNANPKLVLENLLLNF